MERLRGAFASALVVLAARTACGDNASSGGAEDTFSSPLFSANGPVASLTRSTFISSVLESHSAALVWFHPGPECSECKDLPSVVESAAQKLTSWGVTVAVVDTEKETKLAKELGMSSNSHSIMKMYHSEFTNNPYGGLPIRAEEFIGSFKDARGLQKKVLSAIPNWVVTVDLGGDGSPLKKALAEGREDYAAVLVTEAGKSSPVLRVLGSEVRGKVSVVQARMPKGEEDEDEAEDKSDTVRSLLKGAFEVKGAVPSLPSLLLVDKKTGAASALAGDMDNVQAVLEFILKGAHLPTTSASGEAGSASGGASDGGSQAREGGELKLDPETLALLQERGTEALVVAFVERGDTAAITGWHEATKGLQGQIRAGILDCSAHPTQCDAGSKKAPHLRVYSHKRGIDGDNRDVPSILSASKVKEAVSEAEASLPEIVGVIPAGVGFERTQDAVESFVGSAMVAEGSPMVLLVMSKREEPTLVVKTIAAEFQTAKVRVLFISKPDQQVLSSLGMNKLPGMLLMFQATDDMPMSEDRRPPEDGQQAMVTAAYSPAQWGPVTHRGVSEFILAYLRNIDKELFFKHLVELSETYVLNGEKMNSQLDALLHEYTQSGASSASSRESSGAGKRPAAPVSFQGIPEATVAGWESMVSGEGTGSEPPRAVGVFLLDRYSESFGSAFAAAEKAADKAAGKDGAGLRFVWADAPCQEGFAKAFGVSDTAEVPALVVLSPKHQKSARFVGAWEADSLSSFLVKAMGGRAPMFPVGDETPRLEAIDCSQRALPSWLAAGDGEGGGGEEDMGDFMAEILAEEAKAKRELEEEVARGMQELRDAEEGKDSAAPKKKTKKVVKRKKKKTTGTGSTEL